MLIVVQIPLYDPRGDTFPGVEARLEKPHWPTPAVKRSFIRSSGAVFERGQKGLSGFFAEDRLCDARKLVRFPRIDALSTVELDDGALVSRATPRIAFRHFFMDGRHTAKLEIGFFLPPTPSRDGIIGSNFQDLVEHILSLPMEIGPERVQTKLIHAGDATACVVERATGRHTGKLGRAWRRVARGVPSELRAGPPLLLAVMDAKLFVGGLPRNPSLAQVGASTIGAWRQELDKQRYDLVLISQPERSADLVRNIRLFLNRCHAELVSLEFALSDITDAAESKPSRRKLAKLKTTLVSLQEARLERLAALSRRVGKSARALRGSIEDDPVEIGGAVLSKIWGGRVDSVYERADLLSEKLNSSRQASTGPAVLRGLKRSVFLSYRRDDTGDLARRVAAQLEQAFPRLDIFLDIHKLTPGGAWRRELESAIAACSHVLGFMGARWVGEDPLGGRRIDNPIDTVRLEIETTLQSEKRFLPVIADRSNFPPTNLPSSLRNLSAHNGIFVERELTTEHIEALEQFLRIV